MTNADCKELDDQLEALALGAVPEPTRSQMHAHIATCAECRGRFDEVLGLSDRLLALAPQHEPPAGFESRVLDRLNVPDSLAWPTAAKLVGVAAALLIVLAAVGAVAIDRRVRDEGLTIARSGVIVRGDGSQVGDVQLIGGDRPFVLVALDHPNPGPGSVSCQLELPDGRTVIVGSWSYEDVRGGVWAAGLDEASLAAVAMQIVDADGTVLASAVLQA